MRTIHQVHPSDFASYNTQQIRDKFLLDGLVSPGKLECTYTHYDRMIIGAAYPSGQSLELATFPELRSDYFLERREIGIINIGGPGSISVDGEKYKLQKLDCLYVGKGKQEIVFREGELSKYVFFSCPAHAAYPTQLMKSSEALPAELGSLDNNNHRTINKYIHLDGIRSCQLVLGVTTFRQGSIWNTMPAHTHDRRMEAYFYFDLAEGQRIVHFMGEPTETRHLFLNNEEGVVSPTWSIHSGVATGNYSFIWAMAGENLVFTDMDPVPVGLLR